MMKHLTSAAAAVAALALVAATAPAGAGSGQNRAAGTATTQITGAEVTITGGPLAVPPVSVLDLVSVASTDTDTDRNAVGVPFSSVTAIPARIGEQVFGQTSVSSDGENDATAAAVDETAGPLSVVATVLDLHASVTEDTATALLDAAGATIEVLDGASGLALDEAGSTAEVSAHRAAAFQGVTLVGLAVDLGDLVPTEQLPLATVVDLAGALDGVLPGELGDLVDDVLALADDYEAALDELEAAAADYETDAGRLETALGDLADAQAAVAELQALLDEAGALADDSTSTQDQVHDLTGRVDDTLSTAGGTVDTVDGAIGGLRSQQVGDVGEQLAGVIADLEQAVSDAQAVVADLQAEVDVLITTIEDTLATITELADGAAGLIDELTTAVDDLLAQLPAVLDALAGVELAEVDDITAGLSATADGNAAAADLVCTVTGVRLAGTDITPRDCLSPLTGASDAVAAAVAQVENVLAALPVADDVVPEVSIGLFADVAEETGRDGAYRTARTHVTLLDLEIPPIALGAVTDSVLGGVGDTDLSGVIDQVADTVGTDAGGVLGTVSSLVDTLDQTVTLLTDTASETVDAEAALDDLLAQLPASDALAGLSTPGIHVTVDPTVTAEFRPAGQAGGVPVDSTPAGDGAPLPTTGGGLAVLAVALMAVGGVLYRRRPRRTDM